jgi:hypothetical protein
MRDSKEEKNEILTHFFFIPLKFLPMDLATDLLRVDFISLFCTLGNKRKQSESNILGVPRIKWVSP